MDVMVLKPQDVYVALKIVAGQADRAPYSQLGAELVMSPSEVHASVRRAEGSHLLHGPQRKNRPNFSALEEFLLHGLKYVLITAARLLRPLLGELVFVGGAVTGLLITDEAAISVVDGRPALVTEVRAGAVDHRAYLHAEINGLLGTPGFLDALPGYLLPDAASQARIGIVLRRLEELASV